MKAWMRVSAAEKDRDGRRRAMFLRWKKAVFTVCLTCDSNERVVSKMAPRLRMCWDVCTMEPSMVREKFWVDLVRDLGPMMIISDLSQFSLRKFVCIQVFISSKQLVRVR